jgi:hypothetical protein
LARQAAHPNSWDGSPIPFRKTAIMHLSEYRYEMRRSDDKIWEPISEKTVLEKFCTNFECIYLIIENLLQGKEVSLNGSVYRIRKS